MKKIFMCFIALLIASTVQAQNYLDVLKISHGRTTLGNIENENETEVSNTLIDLAYPIPVTANTVFVGGFTYENTRLGLDNFSPVVTGANEDRTNLIMTRLTAGIKQTHSKGWTGTYVLLPKFASDFAGDGLRSEDFQIGALALLEKKYTSRYGLKFGTYFSTENFGTTLTPLVGLWFKSESNKFTINAVLPIRADINYELTDKFSIGANLLTSIKSYNLSERNSNFYVQEESIRFALSASYGFLDNSLILRAKAGLDTTDFGRYAQGDTVGIQVLTFQLNGDARNRLNAEFDSSLFFGLDLIYRLPL
jgi:hypothetical protein